MERIKLLIFYASKTFPLVERCAAATFVRNEFLTHRGQRYFKKNTIVLPPTFDYIASVKFFDDIDFSLVLFHRNRPILLTENRM